MNNMYLCNFVGVTKFKSINRAVKRGLISPFGDVYPKRPFNNRANTSNRSNCHSRVLNERKKYIYEQYKQRTK